MNRGKATFRTFIALELPGLIKDQYQQVVRLLDSPDAKVRWVKREQMHLTLKFLGDITREQADLVIDRLKRIDPPPGLKAIITGLGAFPDFRKPRVLWVGLELTDELLALQEDVELVCLEAGIQQEKKPFKAHITLGRVKAIPPDSSLHKKLRMISLEKQESEFKALTFFKSTLTSNGPVYETLYSLYLEKE